MFSDRHGSRRPSVRLFRRGLAVLALASLAGQAVAADTLTDALVKTYQDNPTLLAARAELRGVDETVAQALSGWRPSLSLSGDYGRTKVKTQNSLAGFAVGAREYRSPRTGSFNVSQPLFRGGRTLAETQAAKNAVFAQRAVLTLTEQQVFLAAISAYVDVFRDQAVLDLAVNNEQVLRRQLEATEDRFRVGEVTRTDVSQARARYQGAIAGRVLAEGNLDIARATYLSVVGSMPGRLDAAAEPGAMPASLDAVVAAARKGEPGLLSAQYLKNAAEANVRVAYGAMLPQVSLQGQIADSESTFSRDSGSQSWTGLVQVDVPLYQAGAETARVRENKQIVQQRNRQIEEADRSAVELSTTAWEQWQTAKARIVSLKAQIEANELALDGVQQEATVGSRTVLDVLDAEQELLDSRVNLVRAERDSIVAAYRLKAAMGELTAKTLTLPVQYYDVEAHYEEARDSFWGLGTSEEPGN